MTMTSDPVQEKPYRFLAALRPRQAAAENSTPPSSLPFERRFETSDYLGSVSYSAREMLTTSEDGATWVIIDGVIYRPQNAEPGRTLLDLYARQGADFVRELGGRFALMLVDQRRGVILFATDRHCSIQLLASEDENGIVVSNSAAVHPMRGRRIDSVGVACYLVGGFPYSDRTLIEGVRILRGGSLYHPVGTHLERERYWEFLPTDAPVTPALAADLKRELEEAIVDAVKVQLRGRSSAYLSLSAGNDSRAILGVLTQRLHVPDVRAFTYTHGAPQPMTDEALSSQLTTLCGIGHRLVEGYNGNLIEVLSNNIRLGQGMTDICDEVDVWLTFGAEAASAERPLLFTGDITITTSDMRLASVEDSAVSARMQSFSAASWSEPIFGPTLYRRWVEATRAEIDLVLRDYPATDDYYTLRDRLRQIGREPRALGTWREYFAGRFFDVVSPLTDERVVDVFMRMPTLLRRSKKLYKETIGDMFPELFSVPKATSASYATYWTHAFESQADDVRAWILERPSPLDDLIEPSMLLALLGSDLTSHARTYSSVRATVKRAYRWLRRITGVQPVFARPSLIKPVIPAQRVLSRALVLRNYFQDIGAQPAR